MADYNDKKWGWVKGKPIRFIRGHNGRGENHYDWNGGISHNDAGYELTLMPEHPRANPYNGYVRTHILIAERIFGKPLLLCHPTHHPFGKTNNTVFVICESKDYHAFLHQRQRALSACGHANWRKCSYCKKYDDPKKLQFIGIKGKSAYHKKHIRIRSHELT